MKWVTIMFIVLFVLSFLTYPFKIKLMAHFDVFNNMGCVLIRFTFFELVCQKLSINSQGRLVIETKKIPKKRSKKQSEKKNEYYECLAKKMDIKQFEFYVTGGSKDAYQTSMLCGTILSVFSCLSSILKNSYSNIKIVNEVLPIYGKDQITITGRLIVRFCLMDMLLSILCANIKYLKRKRRMLNGK